MSIPRNLSILADNASSAGVLAVAGGGTGQTTAAAAFNALSPVTTTGDLILGNGTNSATRLAIGTNAYVLTSSGSTASWEASAGNVSGFKNRLINGQMQVAQRGTSGTSGAAVPTTAPTYPSVDRWYAYATGATVTVAQVAGTGAIKNNLQISGAASVTAVGVGQRIEQLNCYDLAGSTCTLSVNMSNSLLTTVTWTASYATSANTWSAKTQIATGTFTVTSTLTNYSAQISVPAAATTGIEILFTVGAQTSGTWVIGNAQLEKSSIATTFDYRPYGTELALCQRYCVVFALNTFFGTITLRTSGTSFYGLIPTTVPMRSSPTPTGTTTIYVGDNSNTTTVTYTINGATLTGSGSMTTVGSNGQCGMLYATTANVLNAEL